MGKIFDLVIIGAGPAGMAAAVEAAGHKLSVLVLDEQPEEGGQIYRSFSTTERLVLKLMLCWVMIIIMVKNCNCHFSKQE